MSNRLFVGNLNYLLSERELRDAFARAGSVESCEIVRDNYDGKSKGFAFVTMATAEEAERARLALDGSLLAGHPLRIELARSEGRGASGRARGNAPCGDENGSPRRFSRERQS